MERSIIATLRTKWPTSMYFITTNRQHVTRLQTTYRRFQKRRKGPVARSSWIPDRYRRRTECVGTELLFFVARPICGPR